MCGAIVIAIADANAVAAIRAIQYKGVLPAPSDAIKRANATNPAQANAEIMERTLSMNCLRLTRHKISDRARERAWLQARRTKYTKATHRSGARFAASPYWSSSSYSWPSGTGFKEWPSEAVNNSAVLEMIVVDKLMKLLVEWVLGKRARTGPLRMCIADRSTIVTILSSGAGRAFIRNESSDEEPVRGL
jgi:hypothetical protein